MRSDNQSRQKFRGQLAWGVLLLGICGCTNFWDDVTSRDFKFRDLVKPAPTPMEVLTTSSDGAKLGRAYAALKEPLQHHGAKEQQEQYMKLLTDAATKDPQPLCRVGAIQALADYKDPRAVEVLDDVFKGDIPFAREVAARIRMQALAAMGKSNSPIARARLILSAEQPGPAVATSIEDAQLTNDERLIAIRELAHFRSPETAECLVRILEKEKGLTARVAHESLKSVTGKNLPLDAVAWREQVQKIPPDAYAKEPSLIQRLNLPFGN